MKNTILTLSIMLIVTMSFAQDIQKGTGKGGKFSLEKDGKVIVNENFDKVGGYIKETGMIPAKLNGKWGFYNNDGKLEIPHQYDLLFCTPPALDDWYILGYIQVGLNGRKFFIDLKGKESTALDFDGFGKVGQGVEAYYLQKDGKLALADKDKNRLTEYVYQVIQLKSLDPVSYNGLRDGKAYTLNSNGEEMGESQGRSTSNDNSKKDSKDKYKYVCEGCGAVEIIEGNASRPSPNKTHCPSPATKNSTSHKWKSMGKVK